jgi:hypothetical protein
MEEKKKETSFLLPMEMTDKKMMPSIVCERDLKDLKSRRRKKMPLKWG